ncbi:hypothetical protein [Lysobacter sp. Root96]|uniref:hypothetical protein n=1 Tax=Lysobacter sp. Root96 TaxID=1736612 RepID=UPI0006FD6E70|nr:hypothetical protein [Lysobacter sp. Root96]KRD71440.1 hypothetical protein ASE45_06420 [Lysobacter sp. Root96]
MGTKIRILKTGRTMVVCATQARGLIRAGIAEAVEAGPIVELQAASSTPAPAAPAAASGGQPVAVADGDPKGRKYKRRDLTAED